MEGITDKPLRHYRLLTVTYGIKTAPFLALKCLRKLAEEVKVYDPQIAQIIQEKIYIDDLMIDADSVQELEYWQNRISDVLNKEGFPLRKWCTNAHELKNKWLIEH